MHDVRTTAACSPMGMPTAAPCTDDKRTAKMITAFVPVFSLPTQLTLLKTELSFVAEDPWNGNRPHTFALGDYVVTLRGMKSVPAKRPESPWLGGFHRALRSEADGVTRFLPESLIELWLRRQVSAEALPALRKQIEPSLKKSNYKPMLRSLLMKIFGAFEVVCCSGLVMTAAVAVVMSQSPLWLAAAVVAGTASVCWAFLYLLYFGKLSRQKRQIRWLLGVFTLAALPEQQPIPNLRKRRHPG